MRERITLKILILLSVTLFLGCTTAIVDTGETLPPGKIELGASTPFALPYSTLNLLWSDIYLKLGCEKNTDIELRVFYLGAMGCFKYRLIKEPFTLSVGGGLGYCAIGTLLETTAYLSKKTSYITPYIAYRHNWMRGEDFVDNESYSVSYPIIACGLSRRLFFCLDFLCEANMMYSKSSSPSYYGSIRLNLHSLNLKDFFFHKPPDAIQDNPGNPTPDPPYETN